MVVVGRGGECGDAAEVAGVVGDDGCAGGMVVPVDGGAEGRLAGAEEGAEVARGSSGSHDVMRGYMDED